jgi:hypothetical protein
MLSAKPMRSVSFAKITHWASPVAIVGGLLWMVYGVFLMLEPWGAAEVYREDLGYQVVTNVGLYLLYSLPGGLALVCTALALLGITHRYGQSPSGAGKLGLVLSYLTLGLGILAVVGAVALFAPVSFAGRAFGSLTLGAASFLVGLALPSVLQPLKAILLLVGGLGLVLLPLQPLVWALQLMPASVAAGIVAVFGLGWITLGYRLWPAFKLGKHRT